jgi:TPP-dependent pyruvate/acetoin dehydrogenase alpha subunit
MSTTASGAVHAAYRGMYAIRGFEERLERLFAQGRIRGSTHLGIGQEAVAVGARAGLRDGDVVLPTYRGHAWALAWGMSLRAGFGEMLGKDSGCARGRAGSKHFVDVERGVLPGNAIVAGALPIACGVALAAQMDGRDQVSLAVFGDGATNQAAFHEALNQAQVWKLPVLFLIENNVYSEMTPIAAMIGEGVTLHERATAYGMRSATADGMDVDGVAAAVAEAAEHARAGAGPTLLEVDTYRFCGHMPGDTEPYRTPEEVERMRERDPLRIARERLLAAGSSEAHVAELEQDVEAELDQALADAEGAPDPRVEELAIGISEWMEAVR